MIGPIQNGKQNITAEGKNDLNIQVKATSDKYTLSFHEVLNEIFFTNGWYQGENFKDGVFIMVDEIGLIHIYEFREDTFGVIDCTPLSISAETVNQKYKRVYTQPEIMRKCRW